MEQEVVMGPEAEGVFAAIAAMGMGATLVSLALSIVMIIAIWKMFAKAGQPGWAILIPIYSAIVFLKAAGKPGWWFLLMLIPVVNIVILIMTYAGLSKCFGRGVGTTIGLILLGPIFFMILGFGSAEYVGAGEPEA